MAAISKLLANQLDDLADAISLAEDKLAEFVYSHDASVPIREADDHGADRVSLEFRTIGEVDRLCWVYYESRGNWEHEEVLCTPLMEVCVSQRLEAAKEIPALIQLVSDRQNNELPNNIRGISDSIRAAVAKF